MREGGVTEAVERRERFLRVCLEAGAPPDKALAQALAMEDFVVKGTVAPLMLMPPEPEPAGPVHEPLAADPSSAPEADPAKTEDAPPPRQSPYKKDGRGTRWTAERIAEFKEMWLADVGISDIGAKFNLTKLSAYSRGKALGLKRRRRWGVKGAPTTAAPAPRQKIAHRKAWTPAKLADFKEMWQADAGVLEIAAKFDLSKPSVYQRAQKMGLGRRRLQGGTRTATTAPAPDRPDAPAAEATPAPPRPSPTPLPDTSDLPAAQGPGGPEYTDIEGVIRFLQSRDIHLEKANIGKTPRWMVEGRRDQALNADELISYANNERRRIGKPALVYGL